MAGILRLVLNVLLFQFGWFAAVRGAVEGQPWWAYGSTAIILVAAVAIARRRARELLFVITLAGVGYLADSAQILAGLWRADGWPDLHPWGPAWLLCLWLNFATLLHVSLAWLKGRPLLAALFGGLGGPFTYWAGARLGALEFCTGSPVVLVTMGVIWAFIMPAFVRLAWSRPFRVAADASDVAR